jgi:hypothetical protein
MAILDLVAGCIMIHMIDIVDKYKKLCKQLCNNHENNTLDRDNEGSHIEQDKIYRKFITDIANGKIKSMKSVKEIAVILKKDVVKYDKDRWYA